mmetsp:Transcript_55946/g.154232  ORF Transcript_55946/g.154232 Transcript_55946/m.154232 type:complete len:108 (+) Transcript_55946:844-1167(+)
MCPTLPYNPQTGYLTFLEGGEPFKQRKQQEEEEGCEVVEVRRGPEQVRVTQGLTTAAAVWMSAALGVTAATGLPVLTAVGTGLTIVILRLNSITRIAMPMKYAKNRF